MSARTWRLTLCLLAALAHSSAGQDGGEDIAIEFRLAGGDVPAVEIVIEAPGSPTGVTHLAVSESWGGVDAGGEDLELVGAQGSGGRALEHARPEAFRWSVNHDANERLRVGFVVRANAHQRAPDPGTHRRPIVNEHLFHTIGTLALALPEHLDIEAEREVRLRWSNFEEQGWKPMSSFGAGAGPHEVRTSMARLWNALYAAGELRVYERKYYDRPLWITIEGEWSFSDEELVEAAAEIAFFERAFFQDVQKPFYWISAIAVGTPDQRGSNLGGTGLTNSFSLMMSPSTTLAIPSGGQQSVFRLLAHEMFHEWNGQVIRRKEPEQLVYWFSEGFTNFYARRLLYRLGRIDRARYAEIASAALEALWTSPVREAPNARILEQFWSSADVKNLPYLRGDVVAMLVDHGIRRATGGAIDLDHVMRELVREATQGPPLDTDALLAKFAQYMGPEAAEGLRAVIEDGVLPELPPDLFAPCLQLEWVEVPTFDLGFDLEASQSQKRVTGVREDSAAHAAGLRDGQALVGWSVYRGDLEREVVLQITEGEGTPRDLRYLPLGPSRSVPRLTLPATNGESDGPDAGEQASCPNL